MKSVAEKKKTTMSKAKTGSKGVKLSFHLRYQTHFGQGIYIYGNHPQLGNNIIAQAVPLIFLNNDNWVLHLEMDASSVNEKVVYHYFIQNEDGTKAFDAVSDKSFDFEALQARELVIIDSWNFTGYKENAFYTAPFKNVLLSPSKLGKQVAISENATHVFRVKAPLLTAHQTICMVGEAKTIGAWDAKKALLLTKVNGEDYYEISLDAGKCNFPFVYKYGIYDVNAKSFVQFEEGDNRVVYEPVGKGKLVIVNDGFLHMNASSWKGAGVAIPVFSLRSDKSAGVGEFADIKLLADWASKVGLKLIQILPINDTTATHTWMDSYPYAAISAFALHPMFVRLEDMLEDGQASILKPYLTKIKELNNQSHVDYDGVMSLKWEVLHLLYAKNGIGVLASKDFVKFFMQNKNWLVGYSVFSYLRDLHGTVDFNQWPTHAKYEEGAITQLINPKSKSYDAIAFFYFVQYHLHLQLLVASQYAHSKGVIVKGDIPIGVYRFGADVWQNPGLFHMEMQAGAPPDDFAVSGQNWGFPTYNWEVMTSDGFAWWKSRFDQMKFYFDAFRIDHILGFFRIWSIPMHAVEGIMGHFVPAIPVSINELNSKGIQCDHYRLTQPFIDETILFQIFGYDNDLIKKEYLKPIGDGHYEMLPAYKTQRQVEACFSVMPQDEWHEKVKLGLYKLISNVILFDAEKPHHFHFRFNIESTSAFQNLDPTTKQALKALYVDYYFKRQDAAWEKEAMQKLPMLKLSTNMLICGEDLGLVPSCVPNVMYQLGMLSLEVQRMPKANNKNFFHPNDAPYLSVVTPSSHDTSTIRAWWEEDREKTQQFYNHEIGQWGDAPIHCEAWINKAILLQHLYSPAMWAIFQLQDYLGVDESIRRSDPNEERINVPANPKHYWRYRMHLTLEDLNNSNTFNNEWSLAIQSSGR
jgi:4-alpha-glucanotransferase